MADRRTVWIAEDSDPDDHLMAAGRFSGHLETEADDLHEEIEDVTLDEALAWARERAEVVLIRLWDSDYFSAGAVNPHPDGYPDWTDPPEPPRRRRPKGLEALDNTEADPPAPWDLRFHVPGHSDTEVLEAVLRDERLRPAPPDPRYEEAAGARVIVEVATKAQADAIALEVTLKRLTDLIGKRDGVHVGSYHELYPHAPDAPVLFGGFRGPGDGHGRK